MKTNFDFYNNFFLTYRDLLTSKRSEKETKFLKKFIKSYDSQILDFGCGWGRHLKALAKLGYKNLTGVDSCEKLLKKAGELLSDHPYVSLIKSDFTGFKSRNKYDFIFQVFQSFGFDTKSYDENNLMSMKKLLSARGTYLLDLRNPIKLLSGKAFDLPSTIKFQVDHKKRKMRFQYDSVTEECNIYSFEELKEMFKKVRLKIIKTFGDFKGNKYSEKSERLIIIAKKA